MSESSTIPALTVGLPVRNGLPFLETALTALLSQDYRDFELVISDNASTDATRAVCEREAARDPRIRYFRNDTNLGVTQNFNRTFELARGRFFKWASHDDLTLPGMLRRCTDALAAAPQSVCLVYPRSEFIDADGRRVSQPQGLLDLTGSRPHERLTNIVEKLDYTNALYGVFRSDVLRKTRLYSSFQGSDWVFFAEVAMLGTAIEIPEVLFLRRLHPQRVLSGAATTRQIREWLDPEGATLLDRLSVQNRLYVEYLRSVVHVPIAPADKFRCAMKVLRYMWRREIGNRVSHRVRRLTARLHRAVPSQSNTNHATEDGPSTGLR